MADLDKVIKGLYACTTLGENGATDGDCNICPYNKGYKTGVCWVEMNRDAMELLIEQKAEIERLKAQPTIIETEHFKYVFPKKDGDGE